MSTIENSEKGSDFEFPSNPQTIVFTLGDEEVIKITKTGFYVHDKLVANDKEVYFAFKKWVYHVNKLRKLT